MMTLNFIQMWYLVIIFIVLQQVNVSVQQCQTSEYESEQHGDSCYFFRSLERSFHDAETECSNYDFHLVYIQSEDEQNYIERLMNDHDTLYCWIGLTLDDNGTAVWMDGSSLTYQNTDYNSHDQGLECLRISRYEEYTWQDTDCSIRYQYTCEKEIECSTTAGSTEPVTTASTTQLPNTQTSISPSTTTLAATITAATTSATRRESSTATGSTEPVTAASTSQPLDTQTSLRPTTTTLAATITATTTSVTSRGDLTSSWYELIAQNEGIKEWNIIERHTASTVIRCADLCSTTESCSCFTFIADDVDCLLGEYDPRDGYMNNHPGATTFVTI